MSGHEYPTYKVAIDASRQYNTFRLGVKGSGNLIERGNAERIRFLSWTHVDGMTSQKDR